MLHLPRKLTVVIKKIHLPVIRMISLHIQGKYCIHLMHNAAIHLFQSKYSNMCFVFFFFFFQYLRYHTLLSRTLQLKVHYFVYFAAGIVYFVFALRLFSFFLSISILAIVVPLSKHTNMAIQRPACETIHIPKHVCP